MVIKIKNTQNGMLASQLFPATQRSTPNEASAPGHQLLIQAGYIRQVASGIFGLEPLAMRVLYKIESIVREEMFKIGGLEVNLPIVQPAALWEQTERYARYRGDGIMFYGTDRRNQEYC